MMCYSVAPVFPGFPGRRDRILSLEMSRDGPTFDREGNQSAYRSQVHALYITKYTYS